MGIRAAAKIWRLDRSDGLLILLLGLVAVGWAGYSLLTGKGYYKGCPPGGYDRVESPFNFWLPTLLILGAGVLLILSFLGVIPIHPRHFHR